MSRETYIIFQVVVVLWSLAVMVKAARALRGPDGTYRFSMWDGGLLQEGQSLCRIGTWVKLTFASIVTATGGALLAGLVPIQLGSSTALAVLIAMAVCDRLYTTKT